MQYNSSTMLPAAFPKLTTLGFRIQDMDRMGVDVQVVSPTSTQHYYWADLDLARDIVQTTNEKIAESCARYPDRLVRFWARAEELGCVVFIHPFGTSLGERVNRFYLQNVIGQPIETTIALSHLIFGGVLDRHPGLKILAAHGGGYLPGYIGRSNHAYKSRPDAHTMLRAPSEYLRQLFFDTLVYEPESLRNLIEQVGATQVVVGTDYPFDMGAYDVHGLLGRVSGLSEVDRMAILGGNAARLLGLEAGQPSTTGT